MKLNNLEQLFQEQCKDLYSAEKQLMKALPKMAKEATTDDLRKALETHMKETEEQINRLEQVGEECGFKPSGHTCKAMQGIIEEAEETLADCQNGEVKDAAIIASAQRAEHYEIAGYGTAATYAEQLGHKKAHDLLGKTLKEEEMTDEKLTKLATSKVNEQAMEGKAKMM
jgi:ferritin-like metal-binding protein YciE